MTHASLLLKDNPLSTECYSIRLFLNYQNIVFKSDYDAIDPLHLHDTSPILQQDELCIYGLMDCLTYLAQQFYLAQPLHKIDSAQLDQWQQLHLQLKQNLGVLRQANLNLNTFLDNEPQLQQQAYHSLNHLNDQLCIQSVFGRQWLVAGDAPSLADFILFPLVALSTDANVSLDDFVHIRRWVKRMHHIPNFTPMPGLLAY